MKPLFIGGYYDGQRLCVAPGVEQIVFEALPDSSIGTASHPIGGARRYIYTRRALIIDGKRVFVFVLDTLEHENILPRYFKLTKGKNHG